MASPGTFGPSSRPPSSGLPPLSWADTDSILFRFPVQVPSPVAIGQDSKLSPSVQTLSYTRMTRGVRAQSIHEQLQELSLSTIYCLLAALMQCLSLASLCVAISLLKWVVVTQNPFSQQPKRWVTYNFGVPEEMEAYDVENITFIDLQKIRLLPDRTNFLVPVITTLCFLSTCFGFGAFLLDFIEVEKLGKHQLAVVTFLHALTGIFIGILIVMCSWCFVKLRDRVEKTDLKKYELSVVLGESTLITFISFAFIVFALILSWRSMKLSKQERREREATLVAT